jgi:hypothetical protein
MPFAFTLSMGWAGAADHVTTCHSISLYVLPPYAWRHGQRQGVQHQHSYKAQAASQTRMLLAFLICTASWSVCRWGFIRRRACHINAWRPAGGPPMQQLRRETPAGGIGAGSSISLPHVAWRIADGVLSVVQPVQVTAALLPAHARVA